MELSFPITQIALDYATTAEALEMASPAVEAGFDWLEVAPLAALTHYVEEVKANYHPRH